MDRWPDERPRRVDNATNSKRASGSEGMGCCCCCCCCPCCPCCSEAEASDKTGAGELDRGFVGVDTGDLQPSAPPTSDE
jgi:hypothetical protein